MGKFTYPDGTTPNICIVGAGFSGLTAAIKLKKDLNIESFQIFDENEDVGGTWLVNSYPGCACDVQSHLYSWSFEPNPNWSKNYSPQAEIWEYMKNVAVKYNLYKKVSFNSQVRSIEWDETINQWRVKIFNKETKKQQERLFDLVINGPGALRLPSYPKEFESFTGPKVHTAEWDSSIELENKVVGIVGSGASAVQVIIDIAPKVKELICYQRKPAWISPRSQYEFSETTKFLFRIFPPIMWLFRLFIFIFAEIRIPAFTYDSWLNKLGSWALRRNIRKELPPGDIKAEQLTPSYPLGCKRIVKSESYYHTLGLSHVKIITENIQHVGSNEIVTKDGKSHKLDVLILATGFQVQNFFDPLKIIGRDGIDILATWKKDGPTSYYGIVTSTAPNHFTLLGPNTALGHNSVLYMIECQANFIMQVIKEMMKRNKRRVTVKESAEEEFAGDIEKNMENTVWAKGNCGAWYANSRGRVTVIWPKSCTSYWLETRIVNHSKFNYA